MKNGRLPCYPKLICDLLGWPVNQLSCATGCHRTQISRVLHGDPRYPSTRKKIALKLELSVEEVFERGEQTFKRLEREAKKEAAA